MQNIELNIKCDKCGSDNPKGISSTHDIYWKKGSFWEGICLECDNEIKIILIKK